MSQNKLAKLRNTDVFKALMRVLEEYRIPKEDYDVLDKRPHPLLTVRYCGVEREMTIPSTPKTKGKAPASYSGQLRRLLKDMQMAALGGFTTRTATFIKEFEMTANVLALFPVSTDEPTMSSLQIAEVVKSRHDNVKTAIERLANRGTIAQPALQDVQEKGGNNRTYTTQAYLVNERDSYIVVAQLSPEFTANLVDFWQAHRNPTEPVALSPAEMFLQNAQAMVEIERRQKAQASEISYLKEKVDRVETAQTIMRARPSGAESITHIRERIGRVHGLSSSVIDEVMRQSPYSPKPAGMVRNDHVDADGALYAVFWQKDVTATFNRFVNEATQVSALQFTHPFILGRFHIKSRATVDAER